MQNLHQTGIDIWLNLCIHRIKYNNARKPPSKARAQRLMLGARLKVMFADLGLTPETAGQMLHVSPRTVRYWLSGKTLVPYSAYRLLRILTGAELPCNGWDGWHMHSGKIWSPEGFGFLPKESSWWSLLVRQARSFSILYDRQTQLRLLAIRAGDGAAAGGRGALAPLRPNATPPVRRSRTGGVADRPNLLLGHFRTR